MLSEVLISEKRRLIGPTIASSVIEYLDCVDFVHDPLEKRNLKSYLSTKNNILDTNSALISKFESLIVSNGGWVRWKETMFSFIKSLERPSGMLSWLLNDSMTKTPTILKSIEERNEIREFVVALLPSIIEVWPPICFLISKLGDLSFARKMLPRLLAFAGDELSISFSHICGVLQSFGFDSGLCEIVREFFEKQTKESKSLAVVSNAWKMFFEQSSLKRLRLESTKNIVRFGRLIGTSKSLDDRKKTILKLILNVKKLKKLLKLRDLRLLFFFYFQILLGIFIIEIKCKRNK